jgi:alpha-glucosidase
MREARARVSFSHQLLQFNQLDSHDTARFLTMLNGNKKRMKMAIAWLMSYIGTPCLYYATEIGMEGEGDPDCRRTFPWDENDWDIDLFAYTKKWIQLRKEHNVLQEGAIQDLYASDDGYVFARVLADKTIVVAVNRGGATEFSFPLRVPDHKKNWKKLDAENELIETDGWARVSVPAESVQAWLVDSL